MDEATAQGKTAEIKPLLLANGEWINAFTCDVEDYFQVSAFESNIPRGSWSGLTSRLARNIDKALSLCSDAGVQGTFFTLGWVAREYPDLVRAISDQGHEIASHGMEHIRVWRQTEDEFRQDVRQSKFLLEDVTGKAVVGYRAASWSIDSRTPWAHGVLVDEGYAYSSSIFPISHDHYGLPHAPVRPYFPECLEILEIPATTLELLGRNWPAAGGGYFRLLPYPVFRWMFTRACRNNKTPGMFYFHPWELDPDQPKISGVDFKSRFRHYVNLKEFESKVIRVLQEFSWSRMDEVYLGERKS